MGGIADYPFLFNLHCCFLVRNSSRLYAASISSTSGLRSRHTRRAIHIEMRHQPNQILARALTRTLRAVSRDTTSAALRLPINRKTTMLVSTVSRSIETHPPPPAPRPATAHWHDPRATARSMLQRNQPRRRRIPTCLMPPPSALRKSRALSINSADPTSIDPTGAPSPSTGRTSPYRSRAKAPSHPRPAP